MSYKENLSNTIVLVNGPNLDRLGKRSSVYGNFTLAEIESCVEHYLRGCSVELKSFQSNCEGALINYINEHNKCSGLILNPGALMIAGWALRDALIDYTNPWIEVHISNIFSREDFRHHSILAALSSGFIAGMGKQGYLLAAQYLVSGI